MTEEYMELKEEAERLERENERLKDKVIELKELEYRLNDKIVALEKENLDLKKCIMSSSRGYPPQGKRGKESK